MFDDHNAQPQPHHRNLPRGGLALPFPENAFSVTQENTECALCGNVAIATSSIDQEVAEAPADRINTRWARHLAAISHELRTPLTGITGFASLLNGPDLTDEQHQLVQRIDDCSQTMLGMVNDLLDEAMAQNGDVRIASKPFSPAQLARDCTAMLAATHDARKAVVTCRIDQSTPDLARGDSLRLRQILTNLLANAIKAAGRNTGGKVQLVVRQRGTPNAPKLVWSVVDNGPGLSAEHRNRIFTPFEQVETAVKNCSSGSGSGSGVSVGVGLGLSIAQKLAEKMGGTITVRSTPGRGSVFSLHHPLRQTEPAHVPLSSLNALQLPRVLVSQSSQSERVMTDSILQAFGFQFDHIDALSEAVTMLRTAELNDYPYIAVLMDVDSELDTALHVIRTLRTAGLTAFALPAYALSQGPEDSATIALCKESGFQGMLPKPLTHAAFAKLAQTLVAPTEQQAANHRAMISLPNAAQL